MPIADSQQRDDLTKTVYQSRNTTIASLVCSQISRVTADTTIEADSKPDLYLVDSTDASVTLTLPPLADGPVGRKLAFYKLVAGNSMIVDGYSTETVEGSANQTRTAQYAFVIVEKVETAANTYAWALHKADVADGEVDTAQLAEAAVVGATLGGGTRANTADTALVLDAADALTVVTISSTAGAGTRTITRGTLPVGLPVFVVMTAHDTNDYTAAVQGGTVTFDAAGEAGLFFYDGTALRFVATGDVPATYA